MRQRGASGGGLRHTLLRLRFIPYEPDAVSTAEGIVHLAAREPHGREMAPRLGALALLSCRTHY